MLFPDPSCRAENTLARHENYGLFEIVKPDWVGIITLTRTRKLYIDGRLNMAQIEDASILRMLEGRRDKILADFKAEMFLDGDNNNYILIPIRIDVTYIVFYLYMKKNAAFSETDFKWLHVYSQLSYQNTLLNNEIIQERDYIENVFDSTESAIIAIDLDGNIIAVNNSAAVIFGFSKDDFKGKKYFDLVLEDRRLEFEEIFHEIIQNGEKKYLKDIPFFEHSAERIFNIVLSPLRDSKDKTAGVVFVGTDITDRRLMEHEMEHVKQFVMLGEIAAGIAHDVKNPLMNIRGCARIMGNQGKADSLEREMSNIIIHEVDRINEVIEQMISFGNVTKKNTFKQISINEVLQNCVQIIDRQKYNKSIKVKCILNNGLPFIKAQNSDIQQVFLNILLNAVQAIPNSGFIKVTSDYVDKEYILVSIIDNGPGIKDEDRSKIFSPYFTTKAEGTGLGLFIVKRVLEQYNGSIQVGSNGGVGTRIIVKIPLTV